MPHAKPRIGLAKNALQRDDLPRTALRLFGLRPLAERGFKVAFGPIPLARSPDKPWRNPGAMRHAKALAEFGIYATRKSPHRLAEERTSIQ